MRLGYELVIVLSTASVAAAADASIPSQTSALLLAIEKFGIAICMLAYFLVRDFIRYKEDRRERNDILRKYDKLQDYINTTLARKLEESTLANRQLANVLETKACVGREIAAIRHAGG
jgi:hypothetical protein